MENRADKVKQFFRSDTFRVFLLLALVSGMAYLPFIARFGYFNDDWYLMYAAGAKGVSVFKDIFSIDRPGRALVMAPAYLLFGGNALYYNLSAYVFRLAGGLGFYWLLRLLLPRQRAETALMALLFLVYPGFLNQPNAIDYQSHIIGLAGALFSIAFTFQGVLTSGRLQKVIFISLSVCLGWFYLSQMEWFIGFEFLRWGGVYLLMTRLEHSPWERISRTLRAALPVIVIPALFLFWRIYLFEPQRGATDLDLQLENVLQAPLATSLTWLAALFNDSLDVFLLAWGAPLSSLLSWVWSRNLLLGGLGLGAAALIAFLALLPPLGVAAPQTNKDWRFEAFYLGGASMLAGLLPVILVNRSVDFEFFSRYSMVASAGAVMALVALLSFLENIPLRRSFAACLVLIAVWTHYANNQRAVQVTQATRDFWWQVNWRIPHLARNTTLITNYPQVVIEEDYFVWGPASLMYYPQQENQKFIQPGVFAALLNQDTLVKTLSKERQEFDNRRTIRTYKNYRNLLVLSQPGLKSCVQVMDGLHPAFSRSESAAIRVIAPYSEVEHILLDAPGRSPPALVFGAEPEHSWCYYYQKAALAQQAGDWQSVIRLGNETSRLGFKPADPIEWMPFLRAYAQSQDFAQINEISAHIQDPYIKAQVCIAFSDLEELPAEARAQMRSLFCAPE